MTVSQKDAKDCGGQEPHIKPDLTITPDQYMKDRVVYKINVYDKLGDRQKYLVSSDQSGWHRRSC
jgi:hypothetical protein